MTSTQKEFPAEFTKPLLDDLDELDRQSIIARYIEFAPVYNQSVAQWGYTAPSEAAQLLHRFAPSHAIKILDAGCGTGLVGIELVKQGFVELIGMDISMDMLGIAQKTSIYNQLQQHDLNDVPYPFSEGYFDALTSIGVLSLIRDPFPVLYEFYRVLKSNGYMIFTQRENLHIKYHYDKALAQMEQQGLIQLVLQSEPTNYLPARENFSDRKLLTFVYQIMKDL